jgi:hypothetical protein
MTEHPDVEIVTTARSPFDAEVIAGVLREAGIPVFIGGQSLNDEFALSQALANLISVEIQVPSDRMDQARKALTEADASSKLLDDPGFDPGKPAGDDGD